MSQFELAEKLGVSQQTISKYEKGLREPDNATLVKLSEIFNCSIDYLLGRTDVRNSNNNTDEDFPDDVKVLMRSVSKLTDKQKEIVKRLVQEFINED